jgi:DNA-binding transcriptional MerR regulator
VPLSRSRDYLSIGEVLESLQQDFADITISKIRFLEAEGLIAPKRTGSGYRMFFEGDLDRLRYILSLQRDHFLPLKVIRERLAQYESNGGAPPPEAPAPPGAKKRAGNSAPAKAAVDPMESLAAVQLSRAELLGAAGVSEKELKDLEDYGILAAGESGDYDESALVVAQAAKRFFEFGVEPRHLKMYRQFADREAAFFEQIVMPVSRGRDPEAQKNAARSVRELAGLARQMREATLRSSLRELL